MPHEYRFTRQVEFAETDMAGIMHFSNYFRFMESAEHAFFQSLGLTVHQSGPDGMEGWARAHAGCDFMAPLRYQDRVEIHLQVAKKGSRSLSYVADFRTLDSSDVAGDVVARGRWTVVCVRKDAEGQLCSVTIPAAVDAVVEAADPNNVLGKDD